MELKVLKDKNITNDEFISICNNSESMSQAASKVGMHRATFEKYAKYLKCYKIGKTKGNRTKGDFRCIKKVPITDIIEKGLYPYYSTGNVKRRLISEKIKDERCEICGLYEWNNIKIPLELDHIDGNRHNHLIHNLRIICPNCHAQTSTYRGKNISIKKTDKDKKTKQNKRTLKQYFLDRKEEKRQNDSPYIQMIINANIDFSKIGWRKKVAFILNSTNNHAGNFVKKYLPEIWMICWRHSK